MSSVTYQQIASSAIAAYPLGYNVHEIMDTAKRIAEAFECPDLALAAAAEVATRRGHDGGGKPGPMVRAMMKAMNAYHNPLQYEHRLPSIAAKAYALDFGCPWERATALGDFAQQDSRI